MFYDLVVDHIVDRTTSGKDIDNKKMGSYAPYSPEYAKKKGVPISSVNMVLNGDMLASFEQSQGLQKNIVKVKMEEGTETLKAFNHNTGDSKGMPKRQFFGIKEEDKQMDKIVKDVDGLKQRPQMNSKSIDKAISATSVTQERIDSVTTAFDILFGGTDDSNIL